MKPSELRLRSLMPPLPPAPKRYIGEVDSPAMQQRAMDLYPVANEAGCLVLAERWQEAIRWLRTHAKRGWRLDNPEPARRRD